MTVQEAIKQLKAIRSDYDDDMQRFPELVMQDVEALDMAIEALKYMADEEQFWSEQYQDIDDYPDTDGDAIRYLDGLRSEITDTGSYEYNYLTMAIEALQRGLENVNADSCSEKPNRSEPLTNKEQRIFLAAMERERKVCKQVDKEWRDCREPYEDSLVMICNEIERKVKGALWET